MRGDICRNAFSVQKDFINNAFVISGLFVEGNAVRKM